MLKAILAIATALLSVGCAAQHEALTRKSASQALGCQPDSIAVTIPEPGASSWAATGCGRKAFCQWVDPNSPSSQWVNAIVGRPQPASNYQIQCTEERPPTAPVRRVVAEPTTPQVEPALPAPPSAPAPAVGPPPRKPLVSP